MHRCSRTEAVSVLQGCLQQKVYTIKGCQRKVTMAINGTDLHEEAWEHIHGFMQVAGLEAQVCDVGQLRSQIICVHQTALASMQL